MTSIIQNICVSIGENRIRLYSLSSGNLSKKYETYPSLTYMKSLIGYRSVFIGKQRNNINELDFEPFRNLELVEDGHVLTSLLIKECLKQANLWHLKFRKRIIINLETETSLSFKQQKLLTQVGILLGYFECRVSSCIDVEDCIKESYIVKGES